MNGTMTRVTEEKIWRRADEFVEPAISIVRRVQEVAEKKGWKMSQVALAWINKTVSSPVVGFTRVEEMEEALPGKREDSYKGGGEISRRFVSAAARDLVLTRPPWPVCKRFLNYLLEKTGLPLGQLLTE
jgi:hypothetical protein